jgi:glycosyltransferase 2 family protein
MTSDDARADRAAPDPPGGKLGRRLVLAMLLGVAVYGALAVIRGASNIEEALAHYEWLTFAAACGLSLGNYALRFLKWEYYLKLLDVRGVPKRESALVFLSGFVLTVTPGKVGEVFKSWILSQTHHVPVERTAPIVVAERVTDLIGVIVLIAAGSAAFQGGMLWATIGAIVVAALLILIAVPRLTLALLRPLKRVPGAIGRAVSRAFPKIELSLSHLRQLTTWQRLPIPSLLSIGGWSLEGVGVFLILRGFSVNPELSQTMFCYATATLAGALVPVPGGLGVTEKVLEETMVSAANIPEAAATASMILSRLATLWFAVIVGFAALAILKRIHPRLMR